MLGGTTTPIPVSTAAAPGISTAAASTAPIVIVRQLKEVRPYDGSTSWKSFREHFTRVAKANKSMDHQGGTGTAPRVGTHGTGS